jgi:hypothetical protein
MRKQKVKKEIIDTSVLIGEQPEAYKKVQKKKQEVSNKNRDLIDIMRLFTYRS